MNYNFKGIQAVLGAKELIDVVLSKTQRKTPTVVHPGYDLSRIRSFYLRKVKFSQTTFNEKLTQILEDFPKLDDIHPFYADLINVLYDKDHFKLALGHVNSVKGIVDNIAKDYVKLMKHGDSLYRLKMLKKAALGRMCTAVKKLGPSLSFLDEVRKHLGRLPSINPFDRTLILTGFPNVGKSSFINNISNANVDVQPYPFTTQSLFVGHTEYNYIRWQVLDTPGILDHSLEERNTIEMQAITALAHLKACIMFFMDISETCGYPLDTQISLFESIKPLFTNKPVIIVLTKTDLLKPEDLEKSVTSKIQALNVPIVSMSNITGEGVSEVKDQACKILLDYRMAQKVDTLAKGSKILKQEEEFLRGAYVAMPKKRDNYERPPAIPEGILKGEKLVLDRPTLKEIEEKMGGAGVFNFPLQEHYVLKNPDWKYDIVPEFMDGKNIADYVDPDILEKLTKLEEEEELLMNNAAMQIDEEIDPDLIRANKIIKGKIAVERLKHKLNFQARKISINAKKRNERNVEKKVVKRSENKSEGMDVESEGRTRSKSKAREMSRSRSKGIQEHKPETKAIMRMTKKIQKNFRSTMSRGVTDRRVPDEKPKHLFSGKRGVGKTDRR